MYISVALWKSFEDDVIRSSKATEVITSFQQMDTNIKDLLMRNPALLVGTL